MSTPKGFPPPPGTQPAATAPVEAAPAEDPAAAAPPATNAPQVQEVQPVQAAPPPPTVQASVPVQAPQAQAPQAQAPQAQAPQAQAPVQAAPPPPQTANPTQGAKIVIPTASVPAVGTKAAPSGAAGIQPTPGAQIQPVQVQASAPPVQAPIQAPAPAPVQPIQYVQPIQHVQPQNMAPAPGAPMIASPVQFPVLLEDDAQVGYTIGVFGPPGSGKTTSLRHLDMGGTKRVLYMDLKGNFSAIEGLVNRDWWHVSRPVTFMKTLQVIAEFSKQDSAFPYDTLVVDHVYQLQEMFISHFKQRDMTNPDVLWSMFTQGFTSQGQKTGPDIAQNEWAVISAAMKQVVSKILDLANAANGGKNVVLVFQEGRSTQTGAKAPEIVGKLKDLIANLFQAFFLVKRNAKGEFVYQTYNDGLAVCKHTFNVRGQEGQVLSKLNGEEPADLGAIFTKIGAQAA